MHTPAPILQKSDQKKKKKKQETKKRPPPPPPKKTKNQSVEERKKRSQKEGQNNQTTLCTVLADLDNSRFAFAGLSSSSITIADNSVLCCVCELPGVSEAVDVLEELYQKCASGEDGFDTRRLVQLDLFMKSASRDTVVNLTVWILKKLELHLKVRFFLLILVLDSLLLILSFLLVRKGTRAIQSRSGIDAVFNPMFCLAFQQDRGISREISRLGLLCTRTGAQWVAFRDAFGVPYSVGEPSLWYDYLNVSTAPPPPSPLPLSAFFVFLYRRYFQQAGGWSCTTPRFCECVLPEFARSAAARVRRFEVNRNHDKIVFPPNLRSAWCEFSGFAAEAEEKVEKQRKTKKTKNKKTNHLTRILFPVGLGRNVLTSQFTTANYTVTPLLPVLLSECIKWDLMPPLEKMTFDHFYSCTHDADYAVFFAKTFPCAKILFLVSKLPHFFFTRSLTTFHFIL